jgi:hypothetical protein
MSSIADSDQSVPDEASKRSGTMPAVMLPPPVAVSQPPACSTEPPLAATGPISVSPGAMPGQQSTHGRAARKPTTKSPVVELVKIVMGGVAGLAIAYCLLLFGFQIDILERRGSTKPAGAGLREATGRPVEPQTSVATETRADAEQPVEGDLQMLVRRRHDVGWASCPGCPATERSVEA